MSTEKELSFLGFVTAGWRRGLITFLLALQTLAIIWLYIDKNDTEARSRAYQEKLNDRLLDQVLPVAKKMERAADTVGAAAAKVDSLSNAIKQNAHIK